MEFVLLLLSVPLREKPSSPSTHSLYRIYFVSPISIIGHFYSLFSSSTIGKKLHFESLRASWQVASMCSHIKKTTFAAVRKTLTNVTQLEWMHSFEISYKCLHAIPPLLFEHSGFGWRLFSVQTFFLQYFLSASQSPLTSITGSLSPVNDSFHHLSFHFLSTNFCPILGFSLIQGEKLVLVCLCTPLKGLWWSRYGWEFDDATFWKEIQQQSFCIILLYISAKPQINYKK